MSDKTRINEKIRVKEVRLIGDEGEQLGIVPTREALNMAYERKLDLVEVAGNAKPPVCRIMDYGKFKYDKEKKAKEAKKKQTKVIVKEIKFKPRIDKHDLETKMNKVEKFLSKGNKVKVSLMLFGRERMHADRGVQMLEEVAKRFEDVATIEKKYKEAQKFLMLTSK